MVLIGGNIPGETQVAVAVDPAADRDRPTGQRRRRLGCAAGDLVPRAVRPPAGRRRPAPRGAGAMRRRTGARITAAHRRPGLPGRPRGRAGRADPVAHVRPGHRRVHRRRSRTPAAISALQPVAAHRRDRRAAQRRLRHRRRPWRWSAAGSAGVLLLQAVVDLPFAVSPDRRRRRADPAVGRGRLVRRRRGPRLQDHLRAARHGAGHDLRHPAVRRPRGRARAARDRRASRSRPPRPWVPPGGRRSGGSPCRPSAGG